MSNVSFKMSDDKDPSTDQTTDHNHQLYQACNGISKWENPYLLTFALCVPPIGLILMLMPSIETSENVTRAELALFKKADINHKFSGGYTPLNLAVYRGFTRVTEFLLTKGADKTIKNTWGYTPLDTANWRLNENTKECKIKKCFENKENEGCSSCLREIETYQNIVGMLGGDA